ncbi:MAG TPA: 3-hydroxyacyl-CoA dehydrogenase NAD-binding domain-containing protein, partial [Parvularculaceae bacterium]|nr:3-hydroxyacyl-CoA dehydrogenase NAD-binding domain-containing protein [Parvularculaceae bacterium]
MAEIKSVGVVGAGQMGNGIAHVLALAGYKVLLHDVAPERIAAATDIIRKNLARQASKGAIKEADAERALAAISPAASLEALADCDLVIESATENQAIKKKIFSDLSKLMKKNALMATNTSSISITGLAATTDRPDRFIGLHFMNPVPIMQLVEVIRGIATSRETFETAKAIIAKLGKTIAVSEDFPAFIVNRILLPMINEAIYTLHE